MTFREKLKIEEPDRVYETAIGGCEGCPIDKEGKEVCVGACDAKCRKCWDREVQEEHSCSLEEQIKHSFDKICETLGKRLDEELEKDGWKDCIYLKNECATAECILCKNYDCTKNIGKTIPIPIKKEGEGVKNPSHYQGGNGMDCMEEMILIFGIDAVIEFCKCNIYKYRYRSEKKNGKQDIEKAENYAIILKELQERKISND